MKNKRIIALITALALVFGCFVSGVFSASALTQKIILNTEITNTTSGVDDKNWYYFTPEQTGIYTFLSYSNYLHSEAYLFIKEGKTYTQLAYSNTSPNYEYYGQRDSDRFCLSYQLEAGKTYYYAAGWNSTTNAGAAMTVKLIFEGDFIDRLEINCNAELSWYTNGSWETDANGEAYYYYNYSKILQNMSVTVYYKNGSVSSSAYGSDTVDDLTITFTQNQSAAHWYPKEDEKYTGNFITVSVLNVSEKYDVTINQDALFTVSGKVCDYISGEAVSGATLKIKGNQTATTDENGSFSFLTVPGSYSASISGDGIIEREFTLTVYVNSDKNNHSAAPIRVIVGDWVKDGIINAKDYAYIFRSFTGNKKEAEASKFANQINLTADEYEELNI